MPQQPPNLATMPPADRRGVEFRADRRGVEFCADRRGGQFCADRRGGQFCADRRGGQFCADRRGVIAMEYAVLAAIVLAAVMLAFPIYMDFMTARITAFVSMI